MYVTGGSLSTMSILDLKSMEWEDSVDFVERQLHYSFVYKNRLYIWGGIMESGDKVVDLCFIDLADYDVTTLKIESNDSPPIFGQHYAQLFGNKMCLIICDQMTSADTPVGIWSLDLDLMVWKKVDDGEFLKLGHWHYLAVSGCIGSNEVFRDEDEIMENSFTEQQQQHASSSNTWTLRRTISSNSLKNATAPNSSSKSASKARIVLFGAEDNSSDDYVSRLLLLDMEQFGFYDIPGINTHEDDILSSAKAIPQSLMYDISTMLTNLGDFTDFELVSSIDANPVPIRVHKTILLARWPHFSALIRSGMTESQIGSLPLPEKTRTLQEFVNYIYTDSVSNAPTEVVSDLLILANLYCLERLQKMCAVRLYTQELTVENSAQAFERAVKVHDEGLIKMSVRFITENFGAVSRTPEFRSLNGEILRVFWDSMPPSATITTTKRTRNSRD
ncbi:hypothetical protein HK098_008096 [Nowakowskiella sp. JEL0407]|nr:hypothetical protein HK098_008082 [Nowakowskiella sp. JEL0407]KAJ3129862.1 hypothetical protein HK098_008096 [Nowakowskiella sp. JEL0407]